MVVTPSMSVPTCHPFKAVEFLLARGSLPVLYWLKKDILGVPADRDQKNLGKFGARVRILESQRPDGSWIKDASAGSSQDERTDLLAETLKNVSRLYDYGCTRDDIQVKKSVWYLFSSQTKEGDFRATSWSEYTPGFHALTLEIMCRLGLGKDERVQTGFHWLMLHRQKDGGWAIPCRTISKKEIEKRYLDRAKNSARPFQSDKSKPFSHFITGLVLRALTESPPWRGSRQCRKAAELVLGRFFKDDRYEDRRSAAHWEELSYPFWSTNILSSLDALAKAGFAADEPKIGRGLDWLLGQQNSQGFWESRANNAAFEDHLWLTLAVLRVLKKFGLLAL